MKIIKKILNWLFNFGELKLDGSPKSSPKVINTITCIAEEDLSCYDLVCLSSDSKRAKKCEGISGGKSPDGPIGVARIAKGLKCL
jgi:hypothetical protein